MSEETDLKKTVEILRKSQSSFYYFTKTIFKEGFPSFVDGKYIEESCNYLQKYSRTMRVAARSSFKSTSFYDFIQFLIMFEGIKRDLDIYYFSYNENQAGAHIGNIKSLIAKNPYFSELKNLKPLAENVAAYTWDNKHIIRIRPRGLVSFSRGMKADYIMVDDPYSDPSSQIHPTVILKINEIFRSVILEAIKPNGEIHIVGTTLSRADIYFDPDIQKEFHARFYPAITHDMDGNEVPTWPEFYTLEQLKEKRKVMGEKAFACEMLCQPFYSTDSFFKKEQLRKTIVNPNLRNIPLREGINTQNLVIAGLDIGKKRHPSSFSVFLVEDNKAIMIHHKIMRGWPYFIGKPFNPFHPSQVEYCREAIKAFGIDALYFDNTRGEFEGAKDSGMLTPQFIPIVFTPKMKIQMATNFEKIVLNKQVELLDDEEMLNSICSVTNDLQKIESVQGHGDDFDSIALALLGFQNMTVMTKQDKEIRTGSPSIFNQKGIPKGF